ncbi:hypothetical protein ACLB2K_041852 [Fragaria x ananassa]
MKINIIGETFTRIPKSEEIEEKKPRIAVKDLKRVQEKSRKRMMKKEGYSFCDKVRGILKDSDKYIEFLGQLYKYSKGVYDLTEFLNLVDDKVRENERLMFELDEFLESCEESGDRCELRSLCKSS